MAVIDDEQVPVPAEPAGVRYRPGGDGVYGGAFRAAHVDATLHRDRSEARIDGPSEMGLDEPSLDRERKLSPLTLEGECVKLRGSALRGPRRLLQFADPPGQGALRLLQLGDRLFVQRLLLLHRGEEVALLPGALLERRALVGLLLGGPGELRLGLGDLVARGLRSLLGEAEPRELVEIGGDERIEEPLALEQIGDRLCPEEKAQISFAPELVTGDEAWRERVEAPVHVGLGGASALLRRDQLPRGRAEPSLGDAIGAAFQIDLPLELREPPEQGRLASGDLRGDLALLFELVLHVVERPVRRGRRLGSGDEADREQRDHARRNRATAR